MFATAKNHLSIVHEVETMVHFADEIAQAGYMATAFLHACSEFNGLNQLISNC
jgi:uncharacterized protein YdhG (YjbR/CyaY superfamily)